MLNLPHLPYFDVSKEEEKLTTQWLTCDCETDTNEMLTMDRASALFIAEVLQPLGALSIVPRPYIDAPIFPDYRSPVLTDFEDVILLKTSCSDSIDHAENNACDERFDITKDDLHYLRCLLQASATPPKPIYRRMNVPYLLSPKLTPQSPSVPVVSPVSISSISDSEDYEHDEDLLPNIDLTIERIFGPTPLKRKQLKVETLLTPISCKRPKTIDMLSLSTIPVNEGTHIEEEDAIFKEEDLIEEDRTIRLRRPKLANAISRWQTTEVTESPWRGIRSTELDLEWQPFHATPSINTNETLTNESLMYELILAPSMTGPLAPNSPCVEDYIEDSQKVVGITPPKSIETKRPMALSIQERLHGFMSLHNRSPIKEPSPETSIMIAKSLPPSSVPTSVEKSFDKQRSNKLMSVSIPPPKHFACANPLIITTELLRDTKFMRTLSALHETIIEREYHGDPDILVSPTCGIIIMNAAMLTQKDFNGKSITIERVNKVCEKVDELHLILRGFPSLRAQPLLTTLAGRGVHYWWCGLDAADAVFWVLDILRRCGRETILETSESVHERFLCMAGLNTFAAQEALRRGSLKDLIVGNISSDGLGQAANAVLTRWKKEW